MGAEGAVTAATADGERARWPMRTPLVVAVLWGIANGVGQLVSFADSAIPNLILLSSTVAAAIALVIWFGTGTPAPVVVRRVVLIGAVAGAALFIVLTKIQWTGDMRISSIGWRFFTPPDAALELEPGGAVAAAASKEDAERLKEVVDFPQFLGPNRNAIVAGVKLAREWSARPPREVWRRKIGAGWSAFAVAGRYAVTQEQRGDRELVSCYDLFSGAPIWSHADEGRFTSDLGSDGPRATPTIVDGKVYAQGALGVLNCLDLATGDVRWWRNIISENGAAVDNWGKSCSPLVVDDRVIVSAGGKEGKSLVAYHRETGAPVWSGGNDRSSYASPTLMTLGGVRQVVVVNEDYLAGHDLADGRVLWRTYFEGKSSSNASASQPHAVGNDQVLVSKGYGIGAKLFRVAKNGDQWAEPETIWPRGDDRIVLKTKFSQAVIRDGFAYGLDDGMLQVVEVATGKQQWKGGRYGHGQILLVDDLLLVVTELTGEVVLLETSPKGCKELGRLKALAAARTWNNLALAGPYLLVRNAQEAACYRLAIDGEATP